MALDPKTQENPDRSLRKGQLGVIGIVFFVVAAAAPLVGMTGAVPVAIVLGNGAAAPGAYLAVGITLLLFSVGYAAMSQRVTNTGAFFAYIGRGLGRNAGIASSFVSVLAYLTIQLAIYGFFGALMEGQVGVLPWWGWTFIAWILVTGLSLLRVDIGAKVLGVLMLAELTVLVIAAVASLIDGGPEGLNFAASFSPENILVGGLAGSAGIAFAFAFASFIGFEATAIYGEESKNPKRSVPRATYLAVGVITVLFALTSFAMVTGLGASNVVEETVALAGDNLEDPAAVLFALASQYVGPWLASLMAILVVSSLFAGLLAFQNAASRYLFALGRGGVIASSVGTVNGRGAPGRASIIVAIISAVVMFLFAVFQQPAINMFLWFSGLAVVAIVLIEALVCIAIIRFFLRNKGTENIFVTLIAPILAFIGLLLGEYLLMSRFALLAGELATGAGVDPTATPWGLSPFGWFLILSPFITLVIGYVVARVRKSLKEELLQDVIS